MSVKSQEIGGHPPGSQKKERAKAAKRALGARKAPRYVSCLDQYSTYRLQSDLIDEIGDLDEKGPGMIQEPSLLTRDI